MLALCRSKWARVIYVFFFVLLSFQFDSVKIYIKLHKVETHNDTQTHAIELAVGDDERETCLFI